MAAVPSIGRASRIERPAPPGAEATSELYERFSSQIFGYCLHRLGSREEAEDATQTTFMNAFRGLARGIVPELEQAWLFKIAHNVCLSRRRSSWRRGRVEAPNNMEVLQEVVPAREKVSDELIRLQDVLEEMPENQRRAILLREWQGLSYREIAEELDLSQGAVETLIFRARRALAAGLEDASAPGVWRNRLRRGADVGGALALVKAVLGGGGAAAVKVAAAVALAGAAVAATAAGHVGPQHKAPANSTAPVVGPQAATPAPAKVSAVPPAVHRASASYSAASAKRTVPSAAALKAAPTASGAPPQPAPQEPAPPTSTPSPAPPATVVQAQAPPAPAARSPKSQGKHGGRPDTAPPKPPATGNPHDGQDEGAPPAPDPAPAATAPGNSGDHGQNAAPGQQDKSGNGNGRGK